MGQNNLTLSSQFFTDLLNNPMKALAPEVSASQKQVQQQQKTTAEFGNRAGGTNAATQAAPAAARSDIINLMGATQTGAASQLSSQGQNLLNTGISGTETAFGEAGTLHDQAMQQMNDLIKSSLAVGGGIISQLTKSKSGGNNGDGGGGSGDGGGGSGWGNLLWKLGVS
jgi:hypothetical protein